MSPRPLVALRTDASRAIGWGHLKRCLALALALRDAGAEALFLGRLGDVNARALVADAGFAWWSVGSPDARPSNPEPHRLQHAHWLPVPPEQDAADTVAALAGRRPAVVVVDHYALDARWHHALRASTGARLVAIDDLADRSLAVDVLIDHNPVPDPATKYAAVLQQPPEAWCTGPRFALLDPVYRDREPPPFRAAVESIGVFMGGTDPGGHSAWVVDACRQHAGWRGPIEIATTSANPALLALRQRCTDDALLQLRVDAPHLADFHAAHALQIGAGGGALWERCRLGTPTLALITAANQRLSVPALDAAGIVVGFDAVERDAAQAQRLGAAIARLIADVPGRRALHERSRELVDGRGAERAAAAVLRLSCC